ncbi:SRPBCC family protein [Fictibacillus barbaricus]|uniref:SRPBCC domain-containing protein n=1 Tax=Fictibacillus barbaricus TaxID=182136 RepID=A0ABS2ZBQ6_9BACL|nr:SRPBCC domain-containing protein [Fictibacillus barbaricus]MBN3545112.1 SRPBCC domain-containing protein [Fictibacillus barbaricus]GGB61620.1 ATPase [Fictibacillus barbaricus]
MSKDFHYTLRLPVSAKKLYEAIATEDGVRRWWTQFADVGQETGSIAEFRFPMAGFYVKAEIQSLIPSKLVEWKVIDSMHPEKSGFSNLRDWEGTVIRFDIEDVSENESVVHFTHQGLTKELECYQVCENGWFTYLSSLKELLVNGQGKPYMDDIESESLMK